MIGAPPCLRLAACAGALLALAASIAPPLSASPAAFALPSGMEALLFEIIWEEQDRLGRFRFIAPALAAHADDTASIETDMLALCDDFARPVQNGLRPGWQLVVVSLAEAPVAFGEYDPAVLQLFGGFTIGPPRCQWDDF